MKVVQRLYPSKLTILIFILLWLLVLGGHIQSWAFSDSGTKPPGYDMLRFLPLWPFATMVLLPLLALTSPFMNVGFDVTSLSSWYGILIVGIYLYILACIGGAIVTFLHSKRHPS